MSTEIEALEKGHRFPATSFVLDQETVGRYTAAVEDQALPSLAEAEGKALVPPMAVAALALRALMEALALPAGAVHASQEFQFLQPALVGERITTSAWLAQRSQRSQRVIIDDDPCVQRSDILRDRLVDLGVSWRDITGSTRLAHHVGQPQIAFPTCRPLPPLGEPVDKVSDKTLP